MTEALLFISVGSLLTVGAAILVIAALTLQNARKYVELAEARMEHLREEQARIVVFLREERRSLKEELERERELRLEAQRQAEWASRERLPQWQAQRLAEGFDGEQHLGVLQEREGQEWELRARQDIEHRIDELKREFQKLRGVQQDREAERESSSPVSKETFEDILGPREFLGEKTLSPEKVREAGRMPSSPDTKAPKPADTSPEDKKPRLAVWHPHPDDDVSPGRTSARPMSDSPVKMFRRHYDKYLENYEGYVKLVERLYRMRDNAEVPIGSLAERQWEGRLRRVTDGIERTTARLDLLEEYNPELATDDRISRRASIARSYSELERSGRDL
jgi:hypothetical protein